MLFGFITPNKGMDIPDNKEDGSISSIIFSFIFTPYLVPIWSCDRNVRLEAYQDQSIVVNARTHNDSVRLITSSLPRQNSLQQLASGTRFGENSPLWHSIKNFGHFDRVHFVLGNILSFLWLILNSIGQILNVENGQILNKQSSIWSH